MINSDPIEFKPKVYKSYVEGFFGMFQSRNHVEKFFLFMNT